MAGLWWRKIICQQVFLFDSLDGLDLMGMVVSLDCHHSRKTPCFSATLGNMAEKAEKGLEAGGWRLDMWRLDGKCIIRRIRTCSLSDV